MSASITVGRLVADAAEHGVEVERLVERLRGAGERLLPLLRGRLGDGVARRRRAAAAASANPSAERAACSPAASSRRRRRAPSSSPGASALGAAARQRAVGVDRAVQPVVDQAGERGQLVERRSRPSCPGPAASAASTSQAARGRRSRSAARRARRSSRRPRGRPWPRAAAWSGGPPVGASRRDTASTASDGLETEWSTSPLIDAARAAFTLRPAATSRPRRGGRVAEGTRLLSE